jgi:hypothetical protein
MVNEKFDWNKQRNTSEAFSDTFAFLRLNFPLLVKVHASMTLPAVLVIAGFFILLFPADFSLLRAIDSSPFTDQGAMEAKFKTFLISSLFGSLVCMVVSTNTLAAVHVSATAGHQSATLSAIRDTLSKNFFNLVVSKIIMAVAVGISYLFMLVPGLLVYSLFSCVEMLIFQHGYGAGPAIKRSYSSVLKSFGQPLLVNGGLLLIYMVIKTALGSLAPMYEWLTSFFFTEIQADSTLFIVLKSLEAFNTILGYSMFMIPAAGAGILYFSLKEELTKAQIMGRIREIGNPQPKPSSNHE